MTGKEIIDSDAAKSAIFDYCKRKGALAVGVADLDALERIAPPGHRPSDIMPRVKSVIALGVGGQTQGAWTIPAKALAYFGSTETRAYTISYGLAIPMPPRARFSTIASARGRWRSGSPISTRWSALRRPATGRAISCPGSNL